MLLADPVGLGNGGSNPPFPLASSYNTEKLEITGLEFRQQLTASPDGFLMTEH